MVVVKLEGNVDAHYGQSAARGVARTVNDLLQVGGGDGSFKYTGKGCAAYAEVLMW